MPHCTAIRDRRVMRRNRYRIHSNFKFDDTTRGKSGFSTTTTTAAAVVANRNRRDAYGFRFLFERTSDDDLSLRLDRPRADV